MKRYICTITSNSTNGREYDVTTSSACKAAAIYGRGEGGETVTITTPGGRIVSRAIYSAETGSYCRVCA